MKIGTVTNSSTRIPKIRVPKLENNGKRAKIPQMTPGTPKWNGLKTDTGTNSSTRNPKIKIPKSYSNGNNT